MCHLKLTLGLVGLFGFSACKDTEQVATAFPPPEPASYIYVETGDTEMPGRIMSDVDAMMKRNVAYLKLRHGHGYSSPTGYDLSFEGPCDSHPDLVDAVRAVIAKSTSAPVKCSDKLEP
jgi:hypothetical protein